MESWIEDIEFERQGWLRRLLRAIIFNPVANYMPAFMLRGMLRFAKSELAMSNWKDPGGWRSMVISYDGKPTQIADKILVKSGAMSMALRNRRRLGAHLLSRLIDENPSEPVHVLCLGAGPGRIIMDALKQARRDSFATLVDISSDAFDYGRQNAEREGLGDRIRFIQGDIRDVEKMLGRPPDVVKMLGICEYLTDKQIVGIARSVARVMQSGSTIVFNSLSRAHGTDRFFRRVFGLHMIYRTPEELERLLAAAGFADFVSHGEPLGVYHVVVGRKSAPPEN